jgi:hypothetical protein
MAGEEFNQALDDSREIELTVTGRTSGREISNPVWFVRDGEKLYLVPVKGSDSDWHKNILKTPTIRLAADATQLEATATPNLGQRQGRADPRQLPGQVRRPGCRGLLPEAERRGPGSAHLNGSASDDSSTGGRPTAGSRTCEGGAANRAKAEVTPGTWASLEVARSTTRPGSICSTPIGTRRLPCCPRKATRDCRRLDIRRIGKRRSRPGRGSHSANQSLPQPWGDVDRGRPGGPNRKWRALRSRHPRESDPDVRGLDLLRVSPIRDRRIGVKGRAGGPFARRPGSTPRPCFGPRFASCPRGSRMPRASPCACRPRARGAELRSC